MKVVDRRAIVAVGVVALAASFGTSLTFDPAGPVATSAPRSVRPNALPPDRGIADVGGGTFARANDPVATYAAMRDEVNPKPRLQMIDAWARTAVPGADSDLLGMALVDPDESVRTRAQELFERRIQLH